MNAKFFLVFLLTTIIFGCSAFENPNPNKSDAEIKGLKSPPPPTPNKPTEEVIKSTAPTPPNPTPQPVATTKCTDAAVSPACNNMTCEKGECLETCSSEANCAAGQKCGKPSDEGADQFGCIGDTEPDPADPKACQSNKDCTKPGTFCSDSTNDKADPTTFCAPVSTTCQSNADCNNNTCTNGVCEVLCKTSADCGNGKVCSEIYNYPDANAFGCFIPTSTCTSDTDCHGNTCSLGICSAECKEDKDCGDGSTCGYRTEDKVDAYGCSIPANNSNQTSQETEVTLSKGSNGSIAFSPPPGSLSFATGTNGNMIINLGAGAESLWPQPVK